MKHSFTKNKFTARNCYALNRISLTAASYETSESCYVNIQRDRQITLSKIARKLGLVNFQRQIQQPAIPSYKRKPQSTRRNQRRMNSLTLHKRNSTNKPNLEQDFSKAQYKCEEKNYRHFNTTQRWIYKRSEEEQIKRNKSMNLAKVNRFMRTCRILSTQYNKTAKRIRLIRLSIKKSEQESKRKTEDDIITKAMRKIILSKHKNQSCFIYGRKGKGRFITNSIKII